ncbi:tetratricopeptide repeat protein [Sulfolobus acidocaldarius]|uniref:tetratricopeptide repeat protein n=1 Tax=Sulfolobus acidocaldarius TaxID=2285 RepID=UPI000B106D4F|nr:tetratricopeptide repeat protein [Sulfolobus acidocaldarius]
MDLAFVKDGVYYLYMNGSLIRTSEFKVKDNVIGYVLKEYREGKPKLSSIPVHESSKVKEIVEAKLVDEIKNLNAYVFDAKDFLIIHFGSIDEVKKDNTYVFVNGKPVLKTNLPQLFDLMKGNYELVKYLLKEFPKYGEVVRRSIISLVGMNKCDEAITLYNSLEKKYPEESLAVAECYEKREEYLEALKIYSFFSEQKYRELEKRLRDKVNLLIDEFERTYNVKSLFEALSILPTYDAPAIKLGWHFIRKKNHKEAVKYFEEAVRRRRDFTNILSLANAYIQNQQFKEALDTIQEAEKIRRNSSTAYLKGIALEYLNAPMEAQKEFFFACREGLVDACGKIKVYELYTPQNEFDPNSWIGYVLYGYKVEKVIGSGGMGYVLLVEKGMRKFAMIYNSLLNLSF